MRYQKVINTQFQVIKEVMVLWIIPVVQYQKLINIQLYVINIHLFYGGSSD